MALSGGPDSVHLLLRTLEESRRGLFRVVALHVNHGARGEESEEDQRFVERLCASLSVPVVVRRLSPPAGKGEGSRAFPSGFEERARQARYRLLEEMASREGLDEVRLGHTADDQVETVLMRLLEGSGVGGVKGIPAERGRLFRRPLLDTRREAVESALERGGREFRVDSSNRELSFERNWLRHVLLPLLRGRYGPSVEGRLLVLGERFRQVDEYLGSGAEEWINHHSLPGAPGSPPSIDRDAYAALPTLLRIRILQLLFRSMGGKEPGERVLTGADRLIAVGPPSGEVDGGDGRIVRNRYGRTLFEHRPSWRGSSKGEETGRETVPLRIGGETPWDAVLPLVLSAREEKTPDGGAGPSAGRVPLPGDRAEFDMDRLVLPLSLSPVRRGSRLLLRGGRSRKVQDLFVDGKVPRDLRWGRCALLDGRGEILWIPGVAVSGDSPAGSGTARRLALRAVFREDVVK